MWKGHNDTVCYKDTLPGAARLLFQVTANHLPRFAPSELVPEQDVPSTGRVARSMPWRLLTARHGVLFGMRPEALARRADWLRNRRSSVGGRRENRRGPNS